MVDLGAIAFVVRVYLALVFGVAAVSKGVNLRAFRVTLVRIGVPSFACGPIALTLIAYEAALVPMFAFGIHPTVVALLTISLAGVFAGVSFRAVLSRATIPCRCFGSDEGRLGWVTLVRALGLIAIVSVYIAAATASDETWWPTDVESSVVATTLVCGFGFTIRWVFSAGAIRALARSRQAHGHPATPEGSAQAL